MNAANPSASTPAASAATRGRARALLDAYLDLSKFRLSLLVLMTTGVGFVLASGAAIDWVGLAWTLLGTGLSAFGANGLNQCIECDRDRRMVRTASRPIPSGQLTLGQAWMLALLSALLGPTILALTVNALAAGLAVLCLLTYVLIYTPMKVMTPTNTLVGAVVGAIPPMIGWAAVRGELGIGAWILALILFVWQVPHFLALAWLYRDDYARGGYRMLPIIDATGALTCQVVLLYSLTLVPIALMLTLAGLTGWVCAAAGLLLGLAMVLCGVRLNRERTRNNARAVFLASIIYLPLLLGVIIADRVPPPSALPLDVERGAPLMVQPNDGAARVDASTPPLAQAGASAWQTTATESGR